MKGFPNQVANIRKIASGIAKLRDLVDEGAEPGDDGVFGPELVRIGVAGAGRPPQPVEQYISSQKTKPVSAQSMRTTARGLRELFQKLGLVKDSSPPVEITPLGIRSAESINLSDQEFSEFWRAVIRQVTAGNSNDEISHPYQVLLRLVARRPGITRAKCALALEAKNDSDSELDRIVALSDNTENQIISSLKITKSNWDNAKKILPSFAEQLGDVTKIGDEYRISAVPVSRSSSNTTRQNDQKAKSKKPRSARKVSADEIGKAGLSENEIPPPPPDLDPAKMQQAIETRADRLKRHNKLVRKIAARLKVDSIYEDPFDILGTREKSGILVEVKTLSGDAADERVQVRHALAQLLYYEAFVTDPKTDEAPTKCAAFDAKPSKSHIRWLRSQSILTIWKSNKKLRCAKRDQAALSEYIDELNPKNV